MAESYASLQGGALADVFSRNPGFDLLDFDFSDPTAVAALDFGDRTRGEAIEELKSQRRIAQLAHDPHAADVLLGKGWRSAHQIAATPRPAFVRQAVGAGLDEETARALHARAVSVQAATQQRPMQETAP